MHIFNIISFISETYHRYDYVNSFKTIITKQTYPTQLTIRNLVTPTNTLATPNVTVATPNMPNPNNFQSTIPTAYPTGK